MPASHLRYCLDSLGGSTDSNYNAIDYINIHHGGQTYYWYLDKVCDAAKSGTWLDKPRTWSMQQRDAGEHSTSAWSYQYPGHGHGWLGSDYVYYTQHHEFDGFYCTGKENIK